MKPAGRILEAKYKLGLFDDPYRYCDENRAKTEIFTAANREEARNIAAQSFVLLKNHNNILPLKKSGTIALIGPLADNKENMPGTWSVAANFANATSLLTGLKEVVGSNVKILTHVVPTSMMIVYLKKERVCLEKPAPGFTSRIGDPAGSC